MKQKAANATSTEPVSTTTQSGDTPAQCRLRAHPGGQRHQPGTYPSSIGALGGEHGTVRSQFGTTVGADLGALSGNCRAGGSFPGALGSLCREAGSDLGMAVWNGHVARPLSGPGGLELDRRGRC